MVNLSLNHLLTPQNVAGLSNELNKNGIFPRFSHVCIHISMFEGLRVRKKSFVFALFAFGESGCGMYVAS